MIAEARRFAKGWAPALALLLAACGGPDLDRLAEGERGTVAFVRSGHTFVLEDGLAVRLAGVEAPAPDEPYGEEAAAALERLAVGREVRLLYGGARRDAYDRSVAHVRLIKGRRWVQGELLRSGSARVRTWPDNRALAGEMFRLEAGARKAGRGLWAEEAYRVRLPAEVDAGRGLQVVEGRVRRVEEDDDRRVVEMTGGLSVELAGRARRELEAAGLTPERLRGRVLRVRGVVRRGPVIRVDHPEQVEVLGSR